MVNLQLKYRKASEGDIDFLLELRMKTMNEHYQSSGLSTTRESNLQRVLYQYDKAHIVMLNDTSIGLLKVEQTQDKIEIFQLQIDPDFQGKGIGRTILKDLLEETKPAYLSVLKTNKAQNLYSSLGFTIIDEDEYSYFMKYSK